jgi:hypothetical protein
MGLPEKVEQGHLIRELAFSVLPQALYDLCDTDFLIILWSLEDTRYVER